MALRDRLYASHPAATATTATSATHEPPQQGNVAKVADVAVASPGKSKTDGQYEVFSALENTKTADKPIRIAKATGITASTIENSRARLVLCT
jgi:hypothetical protein